MSLVNWGLEVNLLITKAMVCRKGGPLRHNQIWSYGDHTYMARHPGHKFFVASLARLKSFSKISRTVGLLKVRFCIASSADFDSENK